MWQQTTKTTKTFSSLLIFFLVINLFTLIHADNDHGRFPSPRVFVSTLLNYNNNNNNNNYINNNIPAGMNMNINPPRPPPRREDDVTNDRPSRRGGRSFSPLFGRVNGISLDRSETFAIITSSDGDNNKGYVRKVRVGSKHEEEEEEDIIIGKTD